MAELCLLRLNSLIMASFNVKFEKEAFSENTELRAEPRSFCVRQPFKSAIARRLSLRNRSSVC